MPGAPSPPDTRRARPNLYTLPAGQSFLEVLADAVLHDRLDLGIGLENPSELARLTVYLPTRRSARAFASVLLRTSGQKALILPRLVPLGDPGEADMHDLLDAVPDGVAKGDERLPINPLARQLLLAVQIQQASRVRDRGLADEAAQGEGRGGSLSASTLGSAFALAGDLAGILDAMQAETVPYERLLGLDAANFDELWQLTARFLAILGETWPAILDERGECDPITWRNRLIRAQATRLANSRQTGPVIVAGSTGSMPATAELMATVSRLKRGAVVLPDLDVETDEVGWKALTSFAATSPDRGASHPQAQLARLLEAMQASRTDVATLLHKTSEPPRLLRRALAHEALRPAGSTAAWHTLPERFSSDQADAAFANVRLIEAADERGEALSIALLIRQALAEPEPTIALVTPDRGLAERVALELQRWGITVDDTAGRPLGRTPAGHALSLLLDALRSDASGRDLLELLHHPAIHLGMPVAERAAARQALEIGALRGVRATSGLAGLKAAVAAMPGRIADFRAPLPRQRLGEVDVRLAGELLGKLSTALEPLLAPATSDIRDLGPCISLIRDVLQMLSLRDDGEIDLFTGADGEALGQLINDLEAGLAGARGTIDDLWRICRTVMAERVVRFSGREHPRVMLLGPLEARLMSADLVILGGLNEGSWPPQIRTDPFLNRAMRAELGLSSPERRIGQSAHDFIQAFTAANVVLTRALKTSGVQALPSRFWQRLKAITPTNTWAGALERGASYADLASRIDQPQNLIPYRRPTPKPALHLQPTRFSVTEAEKLYRDPYAIFARRILELTPLEPIEVVLGASDRGQLMHTVMERLAIAWPLHLPPDPLAALMELGRAVFADLMHEPDVEAFWWPRFVMLAPSIIAWEAARRTGITEIGVEMRIKRPVRLPDGTDIMLTARADRIERLSDGRLVILDFKTGTIPTPRQIKAGLVPQLLLETAMAPHSSFVPVDEAPGRMQLGPAEVASALYLALKPGADAMKQTMVAPDAELGTKADEHLNGFGLMVAGFRSGERGFTSRFASQFVRFDGDYDHLARVKEWSAAGHDSDEEAP